jgi:hypothetical protein
MVERTDAEDEVLLKPVTRLESRLRTRARPVDDCRTKRVTKSGKRFEQLVQGIRAILLCGMREVSHVDF